VKSWRATSRLEAQLARLSDPLQRAFLPNPDVSHDQDAQEDQHLKQAEQAERLELDRPREKKDGLDVEDHEQDGDNVITDRVAPTSTVDRVNPALVRHELGAVGIVRTNQAGEHQRDGDQNSDDSDENENRDVILRQSLPRVVALSRKEKREGE
jgi:hypothetical protein